jgi:hypothetical protein
MQTIVINSQKGSGGKTTLSYRRIPSALMHPLSHQLMGRDLRMNH